MKTIQLEPTFAEEAMRIIIEETPPTKNT